MVMVALGGLPERNEIMSRQARSITLALALVFLAAGTVQARPATGARTVQASSSEGFFAAASERLMSLFVRPEAPSPQGSPGAIPEKAGCGMDPDGLPLLSWLLCCNG
jgi:hypothetical protein